MARISVIIPVYNRPEEVSELLDSLTMQALKHEVEVIVIDDGSELTCQNEVEPYRNQLDIKYQYQENQGPGIARNNGAKLANGEFLVFLDSDCVLPSDYLKKTIDHLNRQPFDCFGGPDRAHKFFTPTQKAISYSMTSVFTTGGIRGGKKKLDKFYPRSFNLGVRKTVFDEIGGFCDMRYGEDIDFSMNVVEHGYTVGLIDDTYVYHKRRNTFKSFFKQVFSSGTARIELASRHKGALKIVHILPALVVLGIPISIILGIKIHWAFAIFMPLWLILLFIDSTYQTRSIKVGILSTISGFIQIVGYGLGFIIAVWHKIFHKGQRYVAFKNTFYK